VDQTGVNLLVPGQEYRWGVAVLPNAFPPVFLLSQKQCADVHCHGGDDFDRSALKF
jgi:hypothetical protein